MTRKMQWDERFEVRVRRLFGATVLVAATIGCASEGEDSNSDAASEPEDARQIYLSADYGYLVTFDEETEEAVSYAVVDGKCWEQAIPQEIWWIAPRDEEVMNFDYMGQKQPSIPFLRVKDFAAACPEGSLTTALSPDYEMDLDLEYELFQRIFAEHYAFFELREVDWDAQVASGEARLSDVTSVEEFFDVLVESVAPLGDGHVSVEAGEGLSFSTNERPDILTALTMEALSQPDLPEEGADEYVLTYIETQFEAMGSALESHFVADSASGSLEEPLFWATVQSEGERYGYFRITTFAELVEDGSVEDSVGALDQALESAFASFGDIDGLILDVRINDGGWDVLGRALVSHFVEEETHVYSKRVRLSGEWGQLAPISVLPHASQRFDGNVVLLTSATTISAAETFAMAMGELEQVTLVGEATHGIFSDSLPKFLPSGIYFSLSNEEYQTPAGEVFERVGVPPDLEVPVFSKSDRENGRDRSMEEAIALLDAAAD